MTTKTFTQSQPVSAERRAQYQALLALTPSEFKQLKKLTGK